MSATAEQHRQQAPDGQWYLSPRAYQKKLGIGKQTRRYWLENGIPILEYEGLDRHLFHNGRGRYVDYYSGCQGQRIIEARRTSAIIEATDDLVPETIAAKRCKISVNRVRRLAQKQLIETERRPIYKASKNKKHKQPVSIYWVSVKSLRNHLHNYATNKEKAKTITDPISVARAAELCEVAKGTVNTWIRDKKISCENLGHVGRGGRRFVVSQKEVGEFSRKTLPSGDEQEWLYRFQIKPQFPELSFRVVEHYSIRKPKAYNVPPLGRPVVTRPVDRPPGLKCPYERVHQWARGDLRVLDEWLKTRGDRPAALYPTVKRAIDFLVGYLADGKAHSLQDIIAAAAEEGIKKQWLIAAVPHLKNLARKREPKGKKQFRTWRLPQPSTAANGEDPPAADPETARRGRKRSTQTMALYQFCYEKLAEKAMKRNAICKLASNLFPGRHLVESDVTNYARRYAKAETKPWPT